MKTVKFIILTLAILTYFGNLANADCRACWDMIPVKIVLKNTKEIEGYVRWNTSWFREKEEFEKYGDKFPENLLYYCSTYEKNKLVVYRKIYELANELPFKGFVSCKSDIDTLNLSEVNIVVKKENQKIKYSGANQITLLTKESIDLIKNKPLFYYSHDAGGTMAYFLSYNVNYDETKLSEMCKTNFFPIIKKLEKEKVIVVLMGYD